MKTRAQYASIVKKLEILASLQLIAGAVLVFFIRGGYAGIIVDIIIYLLITIYTYTLMKKCRCDKCGSVDVFVKSKGFTVGIDERCHHCRHKLALNKPIDQIHFH